MVWLSMTVLALAAGSGDVILYDFYADYCGPCKAMHPTVERLSHMGYPVQQVDITRNRALAREYRVQSIPCFVLVVDGQEAGRVVGATSLSRLQSMFHQAGYQPGNTRRGRSQTQLASHETSVPQIRPGQAAPQSFPAPPAAPSQPRQTPQPPSRPPAKNLSDADVAGTPISRALRASVRLKIEDPDGFSWGSGTVIDARDSEALVLTCGHVFRDSKGQGKVTVDFFGPNSPKGLSGQVVTYDLKRDVALVQVNTPYRLVAARVAPPNYAVDKGHKVVAIGCPHGNDPVMQASQITSKNKFLGPPNLQVAGQPVQGKSGGGLFSEDSLVIGVCNAADPEDNEGLYAAIESIHAILDQAQLAEVYQPQNPVASLASNAIPSAPAKRGQIKQASFEVGSEPPLRIVNPAGNDDAPTTLANWPARGRLASGETEVICIVRDKNAPDRTKVIVIDRASPELFEQLSRESQRGGSLPSLQRASQQNVNWKGGR